MTERPFRVVQPYGPDKARQATVVSDHATVAEAFAEIDRLATQMVRTGAPSNAVELIVIDVDGWYAGRARSSKPGARVDSPCDFDHAPRAGLNLVSPPAFWADRARRVLRWEAPTDERHRFTTGADPGGVVPLGTAGTDRPINEADFDLSELQISHQRLLRLVPARTASARRVAAALGAYHARDVIAHSSGQTQQVLDLSRYYGLAPGDNRGRGLGGGGDQRGARPGPGRAPSHDSSQARALRTPRERRAAEPSAVGSQAADD